MKSFKLNWFLVFLLVCILLVFKEQKLTVPGVIFATLIYGFRMKNKSIIPAVLIFLLFALRPGYPNWSGNQGVVSEVKNNYVIIENKGAKLLVYTKEKPILDSRISFEGSLVEISKDLGFYSFDFSNFMKRKGIEQCVYADSVQTIQQSSSFRGFLQSKVESVYDAEEQALLYQILFGIQSSEETFFSGVSVSLIGIFYLISAALKKVCYKKTRNRVTLGITAILALLSHGRYLFVQRLLYSLCKSFHCSVRNAISYSYLIGLFLYPHALFSAGFLFPLCFRLSFLLSEDAKGFSSFFSFVTESILYQCVHPLRIFFFRYTSILQGILVLLAFFELFTAIPLVSYFGWYFTLSKLLDSICLNGSLWGIGLLLFLLLMRGFKTFKYAYRYYAALFLIFLGFGWFHPVTEVTYINVGQGDSILIRIPFRQATILIDTGKPSAYNHLNTYLKAKGVHRIDLLMVTHSDNDHAGNVERLQEDFTVVKVQEEHFASLTLKDCTFLDLNTIDNEDENQSSLVLYTKINGLSYLFMGDADKISETKITEHYGALKADILKLSHHGSSTGSCDRFLDTVQPHIGIISAGNYSLYHHPSDEVIQRLLQRHIRYFNTHEEGDISILTIFGLNVFITSYGKIGIIPV